MDNFFAKFGKILDVCKHFSKDLAGGHGNMPRRGVVPKFSDLEVIALALTAETESIDSKPIEVCRLSRGKRCKMGRTTPDTAPNFGYCASQGVYYFGYKLHALTGLSGVVHSYDLSKASVHDLHYLNDIKPLYHDCSIFGGKGYISESVQLDLFETANIRLECPYRLNQKAWKPTFIPIAKARKRVETVFSQLCDQYMVIRNYAKQTDGLFARIIGNISALTVAQYINYLNNQPIGRVKYALV